MKNLLEYYYEIHIDNINKINESYYFIYKNKEYVLEKNERSLEEIEEIFEINNELNKINYPSYKIILTKFKSILSENKNELYILMEMPKIKNKEISFDDIINYTVEINKSYNYINKSNWSKLWMDKIDYIEYQFYQIENKYPIIKESINYYIGLWENAITYYNYKANDTKMYLSAKRIKCNSTIYDLLNPINFIIDKKSRIIGDFLKEYVIHNNWTKNTIEVYLNKLKIDNNEVIDLISRIIFPSYYFDMYELIVDSKIKEDKITNIINKNNEVKELIKIIITKYQFLNIPIINWIKKEE